MLEKIKKAIFAVYNTEEKKGVFLSGFDSHQVLVSSNGVVHTDKPLHAVVDAVYKGHIKTQEKEIAYVVCDVVSEVIEVHNFQEVLTMSPQEFGFLIVDTDDDISGVLLPNTVGVSDAKSALSYIKKKYGIHGQVEIFVFRTERLVVTK